MQGWARVVTGLLALGVALAAVLGFFTAQSAFNDPTLQNSIHQVIRITEGLTYAVIPYVLLRAWIAFAENVFRDKER